MAVLAMKTRLQPQEPDEPPNAHAFIGSTVLGPFLDVEEAEAVISKLMSPGKSAEFVIFDADIIRIAGAVAGTAAPVRLQTATRGGRELGTPKFKHQ